MKDGFLTCKAFLISLLESIQLTKRVNCSCDSELIYQSGLSETCLKDRLLV